MPPNMKPPLRNLNDFVRRSFDHRQQRNLGRVAHDSTLAASTGVMTHRHGLAKHLRRKVLTEYVNSELEMGLQFDEADEGIDQELVEALPFRQYPIIIATLK